MSQCGNGYPLGLRSPKSGFDSRLGRYFSPKYRGKVLLGDVAEVAEEIIRGTCKELDIEIITNFLEGGIKNKKSKSFYIPMSYAMIIE